MHIQQTVVQSLFTHIAADLGHVKHMYYVTCGHGVQEGSRTLAGVSRAVILRVCAQQAQQLQAFKLARWAYTQLQSLRIPSAWQVCLHAHTELADCSKPFVLVPLRTNQIQLIEHVLLLSDLTDVFMHATWGTAPCTCSWTQLMDTDAQLPWVYGMPRVPCCA